MNEEAIWQRIRNTPPRCLRRFISQPVEPPRRWNKPEVTAWRIACRCSCPEGIILGHPLGNLKSGFEDSPLFVSPLAFLCSACGQEIEIVDTDQDGEGAELAKLEGSNIGCAAYRGEGPRQCYRCPKCGLSAGEVIVTCGYHECVSDDLPADGTVKPFEDLFNLFEAHHRCSVCGGQSLITTLDTKY